MNKNYTLKELADIAKNAAEKANKESQEVQWGAVIAKADRPGFIWSETVRAILDAIGYEFPKDEEDEEREAFDAWYQAAQIPQGETQAFAAWKAGRELLRKEVCSDQCEDNSAWIPWGGGDKSPIVGEQTKFEVEFRGGVRRILSQSALCWRHTGTAGDIIAYRILEP